MVMAIEEASFDEPWTEDDFIKSLRQRNVIGMVAECREQVVGYMIYELHPQKLHLWSIAVDPEFRRQSVGKSLIDKLLSKLTYQRRNRITATVRETNLDAHLFFKTQGFRAVGIVKNLYPDSHEDAYQFCYRAE